MMFLTLLLVGCRTKYVSVPEYHYRDSVEVRYKRDSVFLHDSVYVSEWYRGDTVFITKYKEKTLYRDKLRTDTVYITRTDSIGVPYPVEKDKHISWRHEMLMWIGIAIVIYIILWIGKKNK